MHCCRCLSRNKWGQYVQYLENRGFAQVEQLFHFIWHAVFPVPAEPQLRQHPSKGATPHYVMPKADVLPHERGHVWKALLRIGCPVRHQHRCATFLSSNPGDRKHVSRDSMRRVAFHSSEVRLDCSPEGTGKRHTRPTGQGGCERGIGGQQSECAWH